jgi:ANTAR domain
MEVATANPDVAQEDGGLLSVSEASEPRSLSQLVDLAARQVPACSGASAVLWRNGEPAVVTASHPSLPELIDVQIRSGRGPMLDALGRGEPSSCPDTLEETRWPEYASAALRQGVRCSISLAHRSGTEAVSLSLFSARPRTLGPDSVAIAERLVNLGGSVVGFASEYGEARRAARQLRDAADSRAVVDQAKGVLMHALGLSADEALKRMRQVSQARNLKVTEVAARVIESRDLEGLGFRPSAADRPSRSRR